MVLDADVHVRALGNAGNHLFDQRDLHCNQVRHSTDWCLRNGPHPARRRHHTNHWRRNPDWHLSAVHHEDGSRQGPAGQACLAHDRCRVIRRVPGGSR